MQCYLHAYDLPSMKEDLINDWNNNHLSSQHHDVEIYFNHRKGIGILQLRNDYMDKNHYIDTLATEIKKAGFGDKYVEKCVKYASRLLENGLPVIFDTKHLSLLIGIRPVDLTKMIFAEELFYRQIGIPKKSGGIRQLDIPSYDLKYIQHWILINILYKIPISCHAYGFQLNKSIVDNARIHTNKHCVINIDIKDFFPSILFECVFRIFAYYGYTKEVSFILSKLCTYKGKLPQGSPASPYISNIVCLKLDARLAALAKTYQANYSRYADDITFSGNADIKSILHPSVKIIREESFIPNNDKTRVLYANQRQEVTGLIVNGDRVRVPKVYKRKLLQELYYCSKYGVEDHLKKIGCDKTFYKEHIYGKIFYIKMVEPEEAIRLFKIADQIDWGY